jgi:hypothetical protein
MLFLKWILMIPFFCLGVFFTVMGLLAIVADVAHIPYESNESFFFFAIGVLWFIAGVGMCFLALMFPRPPADSRGMSKEEGTIENLKDIEGQRKFFIAACVVSLAIVLSSLTAGVRQIKELDAVTTPEQITSTASFDNPKHELPILFSQLYTLAKSRVELIFGEWLAIIFAGVITGVLIIEIGGFISNRHGLTISMWERIQQLEKEVKELKDVTQPDAQDIAEPESGETPASG